MSIRVPVVFHRVKCSECNSKFALSSELSCNNCSFLGVPCQHRKLCFSCYKKSLRDNIFYYTVISVFAITSYGLGGRLI